jgi:YHS domain-containing protein
MRVVWALAWILLVAALLLPLLRRAGALPRRRLRQGDELVKDPVCQTYVVRSRALARRERGAEVYFCSAECARRYAEATGA